MITANRIECIKYFKFLCINATGLKTFATNTAQFQVLVIFHGLKLQKFKFKKNNISCENMEENITSIFIQIPLYLALFNTLILIYILLCRAFH